MRSRRCCRACWSRCIMRCRSRGRAGAMAPMSAAARRPGSSAAWRCWRSGGFLAALATVWMGIQSASPASLLAVLAFTLIGVGVGAAGTSLLVLLAKRVEPDRRAAAATIVWVMMLAGFIVTAGVAGHFLDPFSPRTPPRCRRRRLGRRPGRRAPRRVGRRRRRAERCARGAAGRRRSPEKRRSAQRWPQVWAGSRRRAASRSSSSSRCSPTARRT